MYGKLLWVLEEEYPNCGFHLYEGYRTIIMSYGVSPLTLDEITGFSKGYINGWEDASE